MSTMTSTKQIPWQDEWTLNHPKMDETHHEFIAEINHMLAVPDAEMLPAVDRFIEHTIAHFEQERVWMESTDFPPKGGVAGFFERVLLPSFLRKVYVAELARIEQVARGEPV